MTNRELTGYRTIDSTAGLVYLVGGLWLTAAFTLAVSGSLETPAGVPPFKILAAAGAPLLAFVMWYRKSAAFREWVLGLDLRLLVMLQSWRAFGGVFLVLLSFGLLPGVFAWPGGLGDIAVGVTAPFVAFGLLRRPAFAATSGFVAWNVLGIFDFIIAVATGTLASGLVAGLAPGANTAAMSAWPLGMIPGFLVPMFTILHLMAIFKARARAA